MTTYPRLTRFVPENYLLNSVETGAEPVTREQIKQQLDIPAAITDFDDQIDVYNTTARETAEAMTNRAIIKQTRTLKISGFPVGQEQYIELPGGNVLSLTSISYIDPDGATQTFAAPNYTLESGTRHNTARIYLAYDKDWPETYDKALPVTIVYEAGYDPDASPAILPPKQIHTGILKAAADLYERNTAMVEVRGTIEKDWMFKALMASQRIWRAG